MTKSADIQVTLVPSAGSSWDQDGRLQGKADLPATDESLSNTRLSLDEAGGAEVIFVAPDEASKQTAALIAERFPCKTRKVNALADLSLGLWEGLEETAAEDRYPTAFKQWRQDPASVIPPEGESFEDGVTRIVQGFAKAADKASKPAVAVVARPDVALILLRWLRGEPIAEGWNQTAFESPTTLTIPRERLKSEPILKAPAAAE